MGYYVTLTYSTAVLPAKNLDAAHAAFMALNDRDDLKDGGSWPREEQRPEGLHYHPNRWFSWMPADLTKLKTAGEVLGHLGFELSREEDSGDLCFRGYDSKAGQEELFLNAIAHLIESETDEPAVMEWRGEDGELWRWVFENGRMRTQFAVITWEG